MRRAFIIGSNGPAEYEPLRYALQDASNIRNILAKPRCGFDVVSPSFGTDSFDIDRQLSETVALCDDEDTFICYFSGHGVLEKGQLFLLLDNTEPSNLYHTALPVSRLIEALNHCKAESKLLILDCCHAGVVMNMLGFKSGLEVPMEEVTIKPDNHEILVASNRLERTRELEILKGGFLTTNVCDALNDKFNDADKDRDGNLSTQDLEKWLRERAKEHNKIHKEDQVPYPFLFGHGTGDFFLASKSLITSIEEQSKAESPYQGLKPFSKETSKFFFGRDTVVELLKKQLQSSNFVLLAGASGSRKSSVVQAGLAPSLEEEGWHILEPVVPWVEPVRDLKHAITHQILKSADDITQVYSSIDANGLRAILKYLPKEKRTLMIVDQFEEIFTVCSEENERRKFVDLLTEVNEFESSALAIVATIRADFIESCLSYKPLASSIQNQTVWIPPLEEKGLKSAITKPVETKQYEFEEGLPEIIIQQIGQEKNFLPLLQFALTELWEQRDHDTRSLTLAHYIDLGGVLGALNRRAEEIFNNFQPKEKFWAKRLFLKLVRTGMEGKDTRQRQSKQKILQISGQDLEEQRVLKKVVKRLTQERLIVSGKDVEGSAWIDLAHESLMGEWKRFAEWRKEDRELRRLVDRIEDAQREWIHYQKDEKFSMGRGLLAQIQESWLDLEPYLTAETIDFYDFSQVFEQNATKGSESQKQHKELKNHQLEAQIYRDRALAAKDAEIEVHRKQSQQFLELIKVVASRHITIENTVTSERRADDGNIVYHMRGANIGSIITSTVHGEQHNYSPDKSLAEAAAEIQQLLDQLSKTYPTITETAEGTSELVNQEIFRNPTLKERILSALKNGGATALQEMISHPMASVLIAAVEGLRESDNYGDGTTPDSQLRNARPQPTDDESEIL